MSKHSQFERPEFKRPYQIHPIWSGIGCILLILVPVLSVSGAVELVNYGVRNGWPLASELLGRPRVNPLIFRIPLISEVGRWIASTEHLYAYALFSIMFLILFAGVISLLYAVIYRLFGPPRYTRIDAPPPKVKAKSYKR